MIYPTVRFVFDRKHVASVTRRGLVQIEILYRRQRKWLGTGVKLLANQWHPQRMVVNTPEAGVLNAQLLEASTKVRKVIDDTISAVGDFSFAEFEYRFNRNTTTADDTYINYVSRSIEARTDIGYYTKKGHRVLLTALNEFGRIVRFSDLTRANILAFDKFLKAKNYNKSTIHNYHKNNKVYINRAIAEGIMTQSPYAGMKVERGGSDIRRYLTDDELDKIKNASLPPAIEKVRDLFIVQCYTGLAYVDLMSFDFSTATERDGKYIIHDNRHKSGTDFYIVLLSPVVEVLEKYGFVLPKMTNQQYNMRLKIVADAAGIDKHLTSHMGRHTFACWCLNHGVAIETLAKMMGHNNIATTQIYAKVLNSTIEKEFDRLQADIQ